MTTVKREKQRKHLSAKYGWIVSAILLVALALIVCGFFFVREHSDQHGGVDFEQIQDELVQELIDRQGEYDERSIVLSGTSEATAKRLADKLNATLRITSDGSFATLTLPEGVSFLDIAQSEEYLSDLPRMSIDYQARICEVVEEDESVNGERSPMRPQYTVTDGSYELQTYLDYLNMQDVWAHTQGQYVTVAVIDTGIDTDHPEFEGRISEYSYNASEDKIVKDYKTADGAYDWSLIEDEQGHGTSVAGVIGASLNDGEGEMVGIAPKVTLLVIKADCYANGTFKRSSDLVFGLYYAIERDVSVVNMSFGTYDPNNPFAEPAQLAVDSDVICVAAAGNHGSADAIYPAADENVIGVGALAAKSYELADFSAYGPNTDLVAPGEAIFTAKVGGGYRSVPGTSVAAPMVTAALALLKSDQTYRYATNEQIKEVLYASACDLGATGPDYYFGYGLLDVYELVCGQQGTVTFDYLTDEIDATKQLFIVGKPLQSVPEPTRDYCVFDGWYYDPEYNEPVNLYTDTFSADITLYAKWGNEADGLPYTYRVLDDGTIEILSYTGRRNYVTVPEVIDNRIVTSIGDEAFKEQVSLMEVKLPSTLRHIGKAAFYSCYNLRFIEIPDQVTEIEEEAFYYNSRLAYVTFGENSKLQTIGNFAFSDCYCLSTIELPKSLVSMNGSALMKTSSLKKINVHKDNEYFSSVDGVLFSKSGTSLIAYPAGVGGSYVLPDVTHSIGDYAFFGAKITSVDLNRVTAIGLYAFASASLEEIVIPDSVTSMGGYAFSAASLTKVDIGTGLSSIPNGAFAGNTYLYTITIPKHILGIGVSAFAGSGLEEVSFAEDGRLTTIGEEAFRYTNLKHITFPKSLVKIDTGAFYGCSELTDVYFDEACGLRTIEWEAFCGASALRTVKLPETLTHIGVRAFANTSALTSICFPDSLQIIEDYAFENSGLTGTLTVSKGIESIGTGAFAGCQLRSFNVDPDNQHYSHYDGVLYTKDGKILLTYPSGRNSYSYSIREGTEKIAEAAFKNARLSAISMPSGLLEIGREAFYGCNLGNIQLPATLTHIGPYAFAGNDVLRELAIPQKVITIGQFAFAHSEKLTRITLADDAELARIGFAAFAYTNISSFKVPTNVSSVAQYAFMGCSDLSKVTFAANSKLEYISAYMFDGCTSLSIITFEENSALSSIQAHGLEGMTSLMTLDLTHTKLTNVDNYAFRYCTSLESIVLPETVVNVGRFAFYKCTSLKELSLPATMEHIGSYAFYGTNGCNLYLAGEYLPAYLDDHWDNGLFGYYTGVLSVESNDDWKYAVKTNGSIAIIDYLGSDTAIDLTDIDLGGPIETIGGYAFRGSDITSIVLPDSLVEIQRYAFADTKNLSGIEFPENVSYVAAYAFSGSSIASVTFKGDAVETVERYAFAFTDHLKAVEIPSSLKTLGAYAFYRSGLEGLTFADNSVLTEIPRSAFASTAISSVVIPDSIVRICDSAFRDILPLKSVTLGKGEELWIEANAFYHTGIETLHIPDNVRYIGEYAFVGLENLKSYEVDPSSLYYSTNDGVLYNKDQSKLIAFPAGRTGTFEIPAYVEHIGYGAFENSHLSGVTFADEINLLTISWRTFYNASNITEISLPASVIHVDYYAFASCKNLTAVYFADNGNIKGIYEGAFFGCQRLSNISIPDSVSIISNNAFYGCMSLDYLPLPENSSLQSIGAQAFAYTGMRTLNIPKRVTFIGNYAFKSTPLEAVYISNAEYQDLYIGFGVFAECESIEELTLPFLGSSLGEASDGRLGYIFGAGSTAAADVYVPKSLRVVNITEYCETVMPSSSYKNCTEIEEFVIPEGTTRIGAEAFYGCTSLKRVEIPDSVTVIDAGAFQNCTSLESIIIPDSVTTIGENAFNGCASLENAHVGSSVTTVGSQAFRGCASLESIVLPDSVTTIGSSAFYGCASLEYVELSRFVVSINGYSDVFAGCSSLERIYYNGEVSDWLQMSVPSSSAWNNVELYFNGELAEHVVIPDGVETIRNNAFSSIRSIRSVVIPESVTSIGNSAFSNCASLESVTIPGSVTRIGISAFSNCASLESVTIPGSVTSIGYSAFSNCASLESVTIPDSVTSIGNYAFSSCASLESVTISNSVTSLGSDTFRNCGSLKSVVIPNSVKSIGNSVFSGCTSLESVVISDSLASISVSLFDGCSSLKNVVIPKSVVSIEYSAFNNCTSLESIVIPDSVTAIGNYAFVGCTSLKSVVIPESVTHLSSSLFYGCTSLETVTIPAAVTTIDRRAFEACSSLEKVYYGGDFSAWMNIKMESYPLSNQADLYLKGEPLTDLTVPEEITSLGTYLSGCTSLKSVVLPDSITDIKGAFKGCTSLESVVLPESLTTIGQAAFQNCTSLTSVVLPDSVKTIEKYAFKNCSSLKTITLPSNLTTIAGIASKNYTDQAFRDCVNLTEIINKSSLTLSFGSMGYGCVAYYAMVIEDAEGNRQYKGGTDSGSGDSSGGDSENDRYLETADGFLFYVSGDTYTLISYIGDQETVTLPTEIEGNAYVIYEFEGAVNVIIPDGVTHIDDYAFRNCGTMKSIVIPDSVETIGAEAFYNCTALESFKVPEKVAEVDISGCTSLKEIEIHDGITTLKVRDCTALPSIGIPEGVVVLNLKGCSALTSVDIPSSVTGIEDYAFRYCTSLTNVTIPDTVTSIGYYVFDGCTSLESVTLPDHITTITEGLFSSCGKLTEITIPSGVQRIENRTFMGCSSLQSITIPDSVTFIGNWAFAQCDSLESVTLPDSVTFIGNWAFAQCDSLESVTLPQNVEIIGEYAFVECSSLKNITIPASIQSMGRCVFQSCTSLTDMVIENGATDLTLQGFNTLVNLTIPESMRSLTITGFTSLENLYLAEGLTKLQISGNSVLTSISIPSTVQHLEIANLTALTSVTIPNSLEKLYLHGTKISQIDISADHPSYTLYNGVLYTKDLTGVVYVCYGVTEIDLPDTLTAISYSAFSGCGTLEHVTIPEGVTSIGGSAFKDCKSLKSITIPKSVTYIGTYAFKGCTLLKDVYYEGELEDWLNIEIDSYSKKEPENRSSPMTAGANLYFNGKLVTEVVIPDGIERINDNIFMGCHSLERVVLPDTVQSIGYSAFNNCVSLKTVVMPQTMTSIELGAFYGCSSLVSIDIPDGVTVIEQYTFAGCSGLRDITLPISVESIGYYAFVSCSVTIVYYEGSVEQWMEISVPAEWGANPLADGANLYCEGKLVTHVTISESMGSRNSFYGCKSLLSVTLLDSVKSIGSYTFRNCSSLMQITLGSGISSIPKDAFSGCNNLQIIINNGGLGLSFGSTEFGGIAANAIMIHEADGTVRYRDNTDGLTYIETPDGFLFELNHGVYTLIAYVGDEETITLPAQINGSSYEIYKFRGGVNVILPDGLTSIGEYAFYGCSSLRSIIIPDSVKDIGNCAFYGCESLQSIVIPDSVTDILNYTFYDCSSLKSVVLPDSLVSIGSHAFYGCKFLTDITIPDSVTGIGSSAFSRCSSLVSIQLPVNIKAIAGGMFEDCTSLKSIVIPDKVTYIGSIAFSGCTALESVTIGSKIETIYQYAFKDCTSLRSLTLGNGIKTIVSDAFQNCPVLTEVHLGDTVTSGHFMQILEGRYDFDGSDNWVDGCLYIDRCLIKVHPDTTVVHIRPDTVYIDPDAFKECYLLKELSIGGDHAGLLKDLSNLETLVITSMPTHSIANYFSSVPVTLSKIILTSGCDVEDEMYFKNIFDVTIFVENIQEDCPWSKEVENWNNDNKVVYGEKWYSIRYYHADGRLITTHYYKLSEVITPPYIYSYNDGKDAYVFQGWDEDGDGVADSLPAAINRHYDLRAVLVKSEAKYHVNYVDKDGRTILFSYELSYGAEFPVPTDVPVKKGYTFLGWSEIPDVVTGDVKIYSQWQHNEGGHDYVVTVIRPTCTERGYTLHCCSICGESYQTNRTEALGHAYGEWHVILDATCEDDGLMQHECACGAVQTAIIGAKGHDYKVIQKIASTCDQQGSATYHCGRCDKTTTEKLPFEQHNYIKKWADLPWVLDISETLANLIFGIDGEQGFYYECAECHQLATDNYLRPAGSVGILSSDLHTPGEWCEMAAPSCDVDGYRVRYCTTCEEVVDVMAIPSVGHEYGEWYQFVAPTCTADGENRRDCERCDHFETREVNALGHDKVQHSAKDATCTEIGWNAYETCSRCDYTTYVEIPAKGHAPNDWIVDVEPAPDVEGSRHKECTACGEILETDVIEALPAETDANTDTETDKVTEGSTDVRDPAVSDPIGTEQEPEKGCSGVVLADVACMMLLGVACAWLAFKRKEESC